MKPQVLLLSGLIAGCYASPMPDLSRPPKKQATANLIAAADHITSWQYFLRHLPATTGPIVDYTGKPIANQAKHIAILTYDVGQRDLQQCADALMRLRAEYLFAQKRYGEIAFRFVSGEKFSYKDYLKGIYPKSISRQYQAGKPTTIPVSHATLRTYLDIVYTFSSTLSLYRDLLPASDFTIGTVIITPGSPGHCSIVIDEMVDGAGQKKFELAESYMPAQSIYVLRNPADGTAWYRLQNGPITTASYRFTSYALKKFE